MHKHFQIASLLTDMIVSVNNHIKKYKDKTDGEVLLGQLPLLQCSSSSQQEPAPLHQVQLVKKAAREMLPGRETNFVQELVHRLKYMQTLKLEDPQCDVRSSTSEHALEYGLLKHNLILFLRKMEVHFGADGVSQGVLDAYPDYPAASWGGMIYDNRVAREKQYFYYATAKEKKALSQNEREYVIAHETTHRIKLEHKKPLSEIFNELRNILDLTEVTVWAVLSQYHVCFILHAEDKRLPSHKQNMQRAHDAYKTAGILEVATGFNRGTINRGWTGSDDDLS